jgi:hypothetical protein
METLALSFKTFIIGALIVFKSLICGKPAKPEQTWFGE